MGGEYRRLIINGQEYNIRANRVLNFIFNTVINYCIFGAIYTLTNRRINL